LGRRVSRLEGGRCADMHEIGLAGGIVKDSDRGHVNSGSRDSTISPPPHGLTAGRRPPNPYVGAGQRGVPALHMTQRTCSSANPTPDHQPSADRTFERIRPHGLLDQGAAEVPHETAPVRGVLKHVAKPARKQLEPRASPTFRGGNQLDDLGWSPEHGSGTVPLEEGEDDICANRPTRACSNRPASLA